MRGTKAKRLRLKTGYEPNETKKIMNATEYKKTIKQKMFDGSFKELDIIMKTYYNVLGTPRSLYQKEKKM